MESPTSPALRPDYYDFLDRMRRPAAADIMRSIKRSPAPSLTPCLSPSPPRTPVAAIEDPNHCFASRLQLPRVHLLPRAERRGGRWQGPGFPRGDGGHHHGPPALGQRLQPGDRPRARGEQAPPIS
jgi:hypothetical protein